ncbi:hypothetical protein J132_09911 [Termitomyces sp. J132]|nr:hypothetical protein J132_09911 [Termitomyces sp. J132]
MLTLSTPMPAGPQQDMLPTTASPSTASSTSLELTKSIETSNYTPSFLTHINAGKDNALINANQVFCMALALIYNNGSGFEGGVGAAAVLFIHEQEKALLCFYLGPASQHTVYKAEIVGMFLALQLLLSLGYSLPIASNDQT